jgi:hypothetical protein
MRSDESGGNGGSLPADIESELREALEALGAVQQSLIGEIVEIHDARRRVHAEALARLEGTLGSHNPRIDSLRAATEQSVELSEALRRASEPEQGPHGRPRRQPGKTKRR